MSAIYGVVDLGKKNIDVSVNDEMTRPLKKYKIDRYDFVAADNVVMGCGIQHIRSNSVLEKLPMRDSDIIFTVDGMLDNRIEVAKKLSISPSLPDGELFYLAYKRWGLEVGNHIRGSFAFAVYDISNNRLVLSSDHLATRTLYYYRDEDKVYFATSLNSIVNVKQGEFSISEEWFTEFFSTSLLSQLQNPHTTQYSGVKLLSTAQMLIFSSNGDESITYWEPKPSDSDRRSDAEMFAELREIMESAAAEVTDGVDKTAIMLSSGLDSTVTGAVVAQQLKKEGKNLYGYTSVPSTDYKGKNNQLFSVNESNLVKDFCEMHKNIVPVFYSGDGNDALTFVDEALHYTEFPFKSVINMTWLYPLSNKIGDDGNRVVLNGSSGNATVSFGTVLHYSATMVYARKNPYLALKSLSFQAKKYKYSRKSSVKSWLRNSFPNPFVARKGKIRRDGLGKILANKSLSEKYNIVDKLVENGQYYGARSLFEYNRQRLLMLGVEGQLIIGSFETKMGLMSGTFERDITRDKRVIELCLAQPMERFAGFYDGEFTTRRLIFGAFSDIMPESLKGNVMTFGVQSADWTFRIRKRYDEAIKIIEEAFSDEKVAGYINKEHLNSLIERSKSNDADGNNALMELLCNVSGAKYLIKHLK